MKRYIIFAGVNGAGKSTFYQSIRNVEDMPRVNADEIVRQNGDWKNVSDIIAAGKIAVKKVAIYLEQGITFNQETTLCGKSIFRNIQKAKEQGYFIELYYVGLDSVELAKERVESRVQMGGHGIPERDIERRYFESLYNVKNILSQCNLAVFYDNTIAFRRIAICKNGEFVRVSRNVPEWFETYIYGGQ